jgi:hypothetical protein
MAAVGDGKLDTVPKDPAERRRWLAESQAGEIAPAVRRALEKWYCPERAAKIRHAEAFEVCEYAEALPHARPLTIWTQMDSGLSTGTATGRDLLSNSVPAPAVHGD